MTDVEAKIASKTKLVKDGHIERGLAADMWQRLGSPHMAIVEFSPQKRDQADTGEKTVTFGVLTFTAVTDNEQAQLLRRLAAAIYRQRAAKDQPSLLGDDEEKPADVVSLLRHGSGVLLGAAEEAGADE